jgi:magnesium-transporting ATPase (P-type)
MKKQIHTERQTVPFWSLPKAELPSYLQTPEIGLTGSEASQRLLTFGANRQKPQKRSGTFYLIVAQFKSPIILILLFATALSFFLHNPVDASIILIIVLLSGMLGFWQENSATNAVAKLLAIVQVKAAVMRDGKQQEANVEDIVAGGDNHLVAVTLSRKMGLKNTRIITGSDIRNMSDEALLRSVSDVDVFAEIEPNQKERIIMAIRKAGNVVGYMGDGINDASALHAADVGISVDTAADVAKDAADIVLLEKDLGVLIEGVREGRTTFANTLKYVFMATSANFGNMFSMAGVSLFIPFLPLLPKQILLTNLLTDFPEMAIARGISYISIIDRARYPEQETVFQE